MPRAKGESPTNANQPKPRKKRAYAAGDRHKALFVREYLKDLNGGAAAIRAGYEPRNARFQASRLLAMPEVQAQVDKAMAARCKRTDITADKVLLDMYAIARADASEISELRRVCCRYCWGKKNLYQRTPQEMRDAIEKFENHKLKLEAAQEGSASSLRFDAQGGSGYDERNDPNPDCPECFGQGLEKPYFKDTRDMSPSARRLFAGVKVTQNGLEVKTHNQADLLKVVGEHVGLKRRTLLGNDPENPLPAAPNYFVVPSKVTYPEDRDEPVKPGDEEEI